LGGVFVFGRNHGVTTNIHPIKTSEDHQAALARIDELMGAEVGTPEAEEAEVLAILTERSEQDTFPIDPPSALDAIRFRMEQSVSRSRRFGACARNGRSPRGAELRRGVVLARLLPNPIMAPFRSLPETAKADGKMRACQGISC
jgi:hypothetical protein